MHRGKTHPNRNSAGLVPCPDLEVRTLGNVVIQEVEQGIALLLLVTDDVPGEALVDEEGLLPSNRVNSHDRVRGLNRLPTDNASPLPRKLCLVHSRVHSGQTLKALAELGGQAVVRLDLRSEEGVATDLGLVEDPEEGGRGRLLLVGDVGVPLEVGEEVFATVTPEALVVGIAVDDVELREALDVAGGGVVVDRAEVTEEWNIVETRVRSIGCPNLRGDFDLSLVAEVLEILVTEDQDLALSSVESKLVEALLRELRELDAADLSAEVGADVGDLSIGSEEVGLGGVSKETRLLGLCISFVRIVDTLYSGKVTHRRAQWEAPSRWGQRWGGSRGTRGPEQRVSESPVTGERWNDLQGLRRSPRP